MSTNDTPEAVNRIADQVYANWISTKGQSIEEAIANAVRAGILYRQHINPVMKTGLTRKQMILLGYIEAYCVNHGFPPSYDEMRDAMGLHSKSGIHRMILALEERGAIQRLPNRARAIEVLVSPATPSETYPSVSEAA